MGIFSNLFSSSVPASSPVRMRLITQQPPLQEEKGQTVETELHEDLMELRPLVEEEKKETSIQEAYDSQLRKDAGELEDLSSALLQTIASRKAIMKSVEESRTRASLAKLSAVAALKELQGLPKIVKEEEPTFHVAPPPTYIRNVSDLTSQITYED